MTIPESRDQKSDAFKMLGKYTVEKQSLTQADLYEFENRLRSIFGELIEPVSDKLKGVEQGQGRIKSQLDQQRRTFQDTTDWIKNRGDANKVEDVMGKRVAELEKTAEVCHNILEKRIGLVTLEFDKIRTSFERNEQVSKSIRNSSDQLQEEYCKLVQTINSERSRA